MQVYQSLGCISGYVVSWEYDDHSESEINYQDTAITNSCNNYYSKS